MEFWTIKFGQELDDNIYLDYLTEAGKMFMI